MLASYQLQLELNQMSNRLQLKQIILKARCTVTNKLLKYPAKMIGCQHLCIYQYEQLKNMQVCICGNQIYKDLILVYQDYGEWISSVRSELEDEEQLQKIIFFKQMKLVFGVDVLKNIILVNKVKTQKFACWPYCREAVGFIKVGLRCYSDFQSLWLDIQKKHVEIQACGYQIKAFRAPQNLKLKLEKKA